MNKEIILFIILLLGLLGTLLPFLPGIPLMFCALLIYSLIDNWVHFSPVFVVNFGLVTVFTIFIDYFATSWGVKKFGASSIGIWSGIFGGFFGIIFLGPLGIIMGSILGVIIGELISGKNLKTAFRISLGSLLGFIGSTLLQFIIGLIVIIWVFIKLF
jgi:hypothetical protein